MKRFLRVILPVAVLLLTPAVGFAYQVTGPVLEVTDTKIVVQKGKEKWELSRDASTKVTGDLKVGSKVTIEYKMHATSIDVKSESKTSSKKK
jgi:hypothetical protein